MRTSVLDGCFLLRLLLLSIDSVTDSDSTGMKQRYQNWTPRNGVFGNGEIEAGPG